MARISIESALVSAGVGVVDVLTKDYISGYNIGPLSVNDATRFGLAVGSWIINYMGYERDYSEIVFYSSLPLVVDSVANIVRRETAKSASSTGIRVVSVPTTVTPSVPTASIPP